MIATSSTSPDTLFYPPPRGDATLVGLPRLMEMAFRGLDLTPIGQALIDRAGEDPLDANALMDLSCILQLTGAAALAQRIQHDALAVSRRYTLPATGSESLRVLAIMAPGALMDNMPIEFLLHGSDFTLEMCYLQPGDDACRLELPPHDVACIGVCESETSAPTLAALARVITRLPRPTLNDPARVLALARESAWRLLQDLPGCLMPPSVGVDRPLLERLAQGRVAPEAQSPGLAYPLICRPRGSHAGKGLGRIDGPAALAQYLATADEERFVLSPFVDYIGGDGQYRKYRIAFIGGRPYPVHMALSARWMVHYLNGDMCDRADNRAEELRFFEDFDSGFGRRHAAALAALDERVGLDYYSIDCGEMPDGRLLVFEIDTGGVVHAMDPLQRFGYKRAPMLALFAAFRALLQRAAQDPGCLKPKTAPG